MPVLFNPTQLTNLTPAPGEQATYTLNMITTAAVPVGVCFRWQFYNGVDETYDVAVDSASLQQIDLVVSRTIPIATVVVLSVAAATTALVAFSGSSVFASGGAGVNTALFTQSTTALCFGFAPTALGGWTPASGNPQFAIGFQYPTATLGHLPCTADYPAPVGPQLTSPNFPATESTPGAALSWTFLYNVVYPRYIPDLLTDPATCVRVTAIKVFAPSVTDALIFVSGEWSNLRDILSQPWTVVIPTSITPARWAVFDPLALGASAAVGPFVLAASPGQLAVLFFQPRRPDPQSDILAPIASPGDYSGAARLGLLVTSPLPANITINFTVLPYGDSLLGAAFGPYNLTGGTFVDHAPTFQWVTGSCPVPAGTVVMISNIGSAAGSDPMIQDAHDSTHNVGAIVHNTLTEESAVPSLILVSDWVQGGTGTPRPLAANRFVTAVTSTWYSGSAVPLSPGFTMPITRTYGAVAYGLGRRFDNSNLPGPVQAGLINASTLTPLTYAEATAVQPGDLPTFTGMTRYQW
jgi:hypothetical protein